MGKIVGLGGIFFRSQDPDALRAWYEKHLGVPNQPYGTSFLPENLPRGGYHLWSPFPQDTDYFGSSEQSFMMNLMVDDLKACLEQVKAGGATGVRGPEDSEYGRFGWFLDPEGRQVELWQPAATPPSDVQ